MFPSIAVLAAVLATGVETSAQCGVYLRPMSTRQIPFSKVYLDGSVDFNNDGKADLLASQDVSGSDSSVERILLVPGNGDGTFGTATAIDAPVDFDSTYAAARINSDSLPDIVAFPDYSTDPSTLLVYLNNGDGTFTARPAASAAGMGRLIELADLNGDGKTDYFGWMWNSGQLKISLGNGDGTFASPSAVGIAGVGRGGDYNGDGRRDYATSGVLQINNGDLTFTSYDFSAVIAGDVIWGVADYNSDGRSDLLVAGISPTPRFAVLTSTGTGFTRTDFQIAAGTGTAVEGNSETGNFAGNPAPDIVFSYRYQDKKVVFVNDGAGNFTRQDLDGRFNLYNFLRSVRADFDNDGKTDIVQANSGITNSRPMFRDVTSITFLKNVCTRPGQPRVVDLGGTGTTNLSYWNPATGDWFIQPTASGPTAANPVNWGRGSLGDIPTPGDFDGDGVTDRAVYRDGTGQWYIRRSSDLTWFVMKFGLPGDKPVAADYDGDSVTDLAVWRPSDGTWYFWYMGPQQFSATRFGLGGDKPVPADFDGDRRTDIAVYRPSTGIWYVYRSSDSGYLIANWGIATDRPIPADFDGDGRADLSVHRESDSVAYILRSSNGQASYYQFGSPGDVLQIGDFDGDFIADIAAYRPSTQAWFTSAWPVSIGSYGTPGAVPTSSVLRIE